MRSVGALEASLNSEAGSPGGVSSNPKRPQEAREEEEPRRKPPGEGDSNDLCVATPLYSRRWPMATTHSHGFKEPKTRKERHKSGGQNGLWAEEE